VKADPSRDPRASRARSLPRGERDDGAAPVVVGTFGRAHGVRGEVRLKSFTGDPLAIAGYGQLAGDDGGLYSLASVRLLPGAPGMLVARVTGIDGRDEAEALNRVTLHVPRARLPAPGADEFYLADLIGLAVATQDGTVIGTIAAMHDFGAGGIVEIAPAGGGRTALLPFTKAFVPTIDVAGRRAVVTAGDLFATDEKPPPDADVG